MNTDETNKFKQTHLEKWHETTRYYLFADQESLADAAVKALLASKLDSHGAQDHLISRVRGRLLRLLTRAAQHDQNPLQELERGFYFQVWFISQHPDVSKRLLGWLSQGSDTRIRRRIQMVIDQYESRICRMMEQAKHQGLIRSDIEPHTAASLFIGMIQSLAIRMNTDFHQRELLLREAVEVFTLYRARMAAPSN
ncbi:MAG: hypothetical protein KJ614_01765 [Gammaproteobacteria bacterium]|jgi:TetR/AcrR family transcriptional regulator|uniref:hypothetical protein n=1 Tax=Rhodoferax sp. TaxID=50421 RepID=UPI0017BB3F59|nr:hypothetical protein [Rhodoferax sp.]MBU3897651.1 hypothetical protein [Gammaproteobacteria bacterium]MBA3058277.1 hypothetical protein [Rhodoferax sp.]MBU3999444.1 hypothetical protein [Gammaproteobacteria bacterium]MBU4017705.1 hypothetical protein [Gammaproteobacteria bacterium]MBU4081148.1 hypothetical protein [Gammaproteobacteria bacterium]